MSSIKTKGKALVCAILERQAMQLRAKHRFTIVTVSGSIGKTSTKQAIAHILTESGKRVRFQSGNYNDRITVPLVLFDQDLPGLFNIPAWLKIFWANRRLIRRGPGFDVAVLELGTDGPGQIERFAYLRPDLAVVTAITPEHMEFFGTLDAVAQEEMAVAAYTQQLLVSDEIPEHYLEGIQAKRYGFSEGATYRIQASGLTKNGQRVEVYADSEKASDSVISLLGKQGAMIALAGAATAHELGTSWEAVTAAMRTLRPVSGRMQLLPGVHGSTLIDDTYNASPEAVLAALDVLVALPAKRRIAVLGSMNELGEESPAAHKLVAEAANTLPLDAVFTLGKEAKQYMAPHLISDDGRSISSYCAWDTVVERGFAELPWQIDEDTVILFKGSQNGVFAEEALKLVLAEPADAQKLVRQSASWLAKKQKQHHELAMCDDRL